MFCIRINFDVFALNRLLKMKRKAFAYSLNNRYNNLPLNKKGLIILLCQIINYIVTVVASITTLVIIHYS